jgi:hypothetical protein
LNTNSNNDNDEDDGSAAMRLLMARAGLLGALQYAAATSTDRDSASITHLLEQTRLQCDEDAILPVSWVPIISAKNRLPLQEVASIDLDDFFEEYPDCCRVQLDQESSDDESSNEEESRVRVERKPRVSPTSTILDGTAPLNQRHTQSAASVAPVIENSYGKLPIDLTTDNPITSKSSSNHNSSYLTTLSGQQPPQHQQPPPQQQNPYAHSSHPNYQLQQAVRPVSNRPSSSHSFATALSLANRKGFGLLL